MSFSNELGNRVYIGDTRGKIAILLERTCYSWERRLPWSPVHCTYYTLQQKRSEILSEASTLCVRWWPRYS
jgi:hypothetical protein